MLRGLAALVVLVHHAFVHYAAAFAGLPGWSQRTVAGISDLNLEAVLLFFVVSGFSIRISVETLDLRDAAGVDEYAYRRLKRILPLYLFALGFSALCVLLAGVPVDPEAMSARALIGNLLFLQTSAAVPGNWFPPFAGNGPLWSLSYEMFYYLLFPLHVRLVSRPRLRLASALAISVAGVALNRVWPNPFASFMALYAVWFAGVELAESQLGHAAAPRWLPVLIWAGLFALSLVASFTTLRAWLFGMTLLLLGSVLVRWRALHALGSTAVVRALIAGFAWVGGFSYALYLLHFPLLRAVGTAVGTGALPLLAAIVASFGLALAAERLSLRPRYLLLKRRYVGRAVNRTG